MRLRTALGFVVAPLTVAVGWPLISAFRRPVIPQPSELAATGAALFIYAAILTVIFAVPTFWLLRRYVSIRWWLAAIAGLALGAVGAVIAGRETFDYVAIPILGGLAGISFWMVAGSSLPPNTSLERTRDR